MSVTKQKRERLGAKDEGMADLGLYLHIPFCVKRCHFCAFYLVLHDRQRVEQFLQAIEREIALYANQPGMRERTISTVYVGGGTPTVLPLNSWQQSFPVSGRGFHSRNNVRLPSKRRRNLSRISMPISFGKQA
ncbi:MAG: hypothetical protein R3B95_12640 [Nitrospirales bacterium]|nr:hypothetical protein [Nitrospirales bacterium]